MSQCRKSDPNVSGYKKNLRLEICNLKPSVGGLIAAAPPSHAQHTGSCEVKMMLKLTQSRAKSDS